MDIFSLAAFRGYAQQNGMAATEDLDVVSAPLMQARMRYPLCDLALRNLLEYQHPSISLVRRGEPASKYQAEGLGAIIRLASNFTHALRLAGKIDVMASRSAYVKEFVAAGSASDRAREDARQTLSELDCTKFYLPGPHPRGPRGRRIVLEGPPLGKRLNALPSMLARLISVKALPWNVPQLYSDVDALRTLKTTPAEAQAVFQAWQSTLGQFVEINEREHVFGCYLLELCNQASESSQEAKSLRSDLLEMISRDVARHIATVQETATFLLAAANQSLVFHLNSEELAGDSEADDTPNEAIAPPDEATIPPVDAKVQKKTWWHDSEEPIPSEFENKGPLRGQLKRLAEAICPVVKHEIDRRVLHKLGASGVIWVVKHGGQDYAVYFRDQRTYSEANGHWMNPQKDKTDHTKSKS